MFRRTFVLTGLASLAGSRTQYARALLGAPAGQPRADGGARPATYPVGHVRRYGAKGDGIADDTEAFVLATRAIGARGHGRILVDDGVFIIDADVDAGKGIQLPSHSVLHMSNGATLRAKPNALARYGIVNLTGVTNVHVIGGRIQGERNAHTGTAGQWGMGIWMNSARHCSVRGTVISDCWGDGVCVCSVEPIAGKECADILLDHIWCDNNRRQGASIVSATGVCIFNSRFSRTNGTAPSAGIDFEPDPGTAVVDDCLVRHCVFDDNLIGVQLVGPCKRVSVVENRFMSNRAMGVYLVRDVHQARVDRNSVSQTGATTTGIQLDGVRGARITRNTVRGTFLHGVIQHGAEGNHVAGNRLLVR